MCSCQLGFADRLNLNEQRLCALALDVLLKLRAELFDEAERGHRGRITQWTEGAAHHVLGEILNVVDVLLVATAGVEPRQRLLQPVCSLAAGDAPSATLALVEVDRPQRKFDDR